MHCTVSWSRGAENQLARIWILAADCNAVTHAEHQIETILTVDPKRGQHLCEGLYKLAVAPLSVYYEIHAATSEVYVTAVAVI